MENLPVQKWEAHTRKEGYVLFNNTLNTFYLQLFGLGHILKDHSDSERRSLLPPLYGLNSLSNSKGFVFVPSSTLENTYNSLYYTKCGALAGMRTCSLGLP